jgi:hypothetical protein
MFEEKRPNPLRSLLYNLPFAGRRLVAFGPWYNTKANEGSAVSDVKAENLPLAMLLDGIHADCNQDSAKRIYTSQMGTINKLPDAVADKITAATKEAASTWTPAPATTQENL